MVTKSYKEKCDLWDYKESNENRPFIPVMHFGLSWLFQMKWLPQDESAVSLSVCEYSLPIFDVPPGSHDIA